MVRFLFDKRDRQLLEIVNDVLHRDRIRSRAKKVFFPHLHPSGIKEMAESKGLRIAHALVHLLQSLEAGEVGDRLDALRCLRDEVLHSGAGPMPRNTARVLLQIMKELVRAHGDYERQLELAHDFRTTASGKPKIVRAMLRRYHLLEMPEAWNQLSFDDHVHDANTKGRKSSSHLIMDAWIKGIRRLRVIYYNYLEAKFAVELLEAADIMGITVRIGIEFKTRFRDKYAQLIWVPRGFPDTQAFLCFLAEDSVMSFMAEGREVSEFEKQHVLRLLQEFNTRHRISINRDFGLDAPPLDESDFLHFVGTGQPSSIHLSEFIHKHLVTAMKDRVSALRKEFERASPEERERISGLVREMDLVDSDFILERYLQPRQNPEIPDPAVPCDDRSLTPPLLQLSPCALVDRLARLHSAFRITLNLSNLKAEDVIELLYDCQGMITRLEIFNLKDYAEGKTSHIPAIAELQRAINDGNVIQLKRVTAEIVDRLKLSNYADREERIHKLTQILHDIADFKAMYKGIPLKSRIGSDSTGRSRRVHGMGLAVIETLPGRSRKQIWSHGISPREILPIRTEARLRITRCPRTSPNAVVQVFFDWARRTRILTFLGETKEADWVIREDSTLISRLGNIVTLGGIAEGHSNGLSLESPEIRTVRRAVSLRYMNTGLKNALKVFLGFVPAFATFALTKDWWILAYFGAFIWFGITGLRNVLQSVLGGGGIRRSPLLRWNDYVSWERITDSLMFTGFSVPLLDYVVKTAVLDRAFGITTATNPVLLYTVMAAVNGLYLSSHNAFRGLPRGAVIANFFRSILSIPLAVGFNSALGGILFAAGTPQVTDILQKWAAVISKAASDTVAGLIEGTADRLENIALRRRDYQSKLDQLFDTYAQLELRFPEAPVLEVLESVEKLRWAAGAEVRDLEKIIIIHSLDLMYFWMYQPRARSALKGLLRELSMEERRILIGCQNVLLQTRDISLLFVDGLVGKNFSKALSFYLNCAPDYLESVQKMALSPPTPRPVTAENPLLSAGDNRKIRMNRDHIMPVAVSRKGKEHCGCARARSERRSIADLRNGLASNGGDPA